MSLDELLSPDGEKKVMKKLAKKGAPVHGMQSPEFMAFFNQIADAIARVSVGTKMAVVGDQEVGKTHFLTTVPRPLTIIITDNRFVEIMYAIFRRKVQGARNMKQTKQLEAFGEWLLDKEIYVHHACKISESTQTPDYYDSINQFKDVLKVVAKHVYTGTFAIDNTSDLRLWLNALVDKEARFVNEKTGQPYQFEWGAANEIVRGMTETFREKKMHFVLTAHTKPKYGKGGKLIPGVTNIDWNRTTSGDLDFMMEGRKLYGGIDPHSPDVAKDDVGIYRRAWFVRKSTKWPEYAGLCGEGGVLYNMTWPTLRTDVLNKTGFDINFIQE